jgi:tetratricopeptide (TPR) repeat protein
MSAQEYKNKGNEYFKAQKYSEAIEWYTKAVNADPNNETLYSNRAASYSACNKNAEALADAEKCVALKPTWVKGHFRKGIALCKLGRYDEAVAAYAKSLEIEPTNKDIQAKYNEARDLMKREAESKSVTKVTDPLEAKQVGNTMFKEGKYEDAAKWYSRAIELTDKNPDENTAIFYTNRAACNAQQHLYKSVIADCNAAIEINPKLSKAFMRRAMAHEGLEKWQKAADDYKMVMELEPGGSTASEGYRRALKFAKDF